MPEYFSFSQLRLYGDCPRKYYFNYILKRYPKQNLAMAFGFAFHSALEEYYKTGDIDKAESRFIFDLTEAKIELKLGESVEKEGKIGLNMLRKYFYSQEKPYFKAKEVEYKFQVDLKHPVTGKLLGIPVRGVMDMITMDDFIVDHKTSSGIWTMEKLEEDMQSTFY